jgi:hypothetical protein
MTKHCLTFFLGAFVYTASAPVTAAPAPQSNASTMPKGATQDRYRKGRDAYDAQRYEEAGQLWATVLDQIPESPRNSGLRSKLILDIMTAYRAAYDEVGDVALLEQGLEHYFRYYALQKQTYSSPRIPREVVVARYDLKNAIDEAKKNGETENGETEENTAGQPVSEGKHPAEQDGAPAEDATSGERVGVSISGGGSKDRSATPLIAAGAAVLALGVGASAMIAVGAIEGQRAREDQKTPGFSDEQRDRIDQRGRSMNALFIAGLVTTPVLIGTGAALIGVGAKRRKDRGVSAVVPTFGRSFVGVTLQGRF